MHESFSIKGEFITLGNLLKICGLIYTGGQAKHYLAEGTVKVNGEVEMRRGKKLYNGDTIEIETVGTYEIVRED